MKKLTFTFLASLMLLMVLPAKRTFAQAIGINATGNNPDPTAILDISSNRRGILIPRLTKAERLNINSPATGLMVYDNTASRFAYYNGTDWEFIYEGITAEIQDKDLDTRIDVESNPDDDQIRFYAEGAEVMRLDSDGNAGIGVANPTEKLEVDGAINLGNTNNDSPEAGTIRWNPDKKDFEGFTGGGWVSLSGAEKFFRTQSSQNMTPSGVSEDGSLGTSVAMYNDLLIAGAPLNVDNGSTLTGAAFIFQKNGNSWTELTKLLSSDGTSGDHFGVSVAMDGDYAVVGASFADGNTADAGAAYVFYFNGTSWAQQAKIVASDGAASDLFGQSVDISGDYIVVGAPQDDEGGAESGSVYVFKRNGINWVQDEKINYTGGTADELFGRSVSIDEKYILVGAPGNLPGMKGSAYLYHRSGNTYTLNALYRPSDVANGDYFGGDVDINGDYFIVGALGHDALANNAGAAYLYRRNAGLVSSLMGSSWFLQSKLMASDGDGEDKFGSSVSISRDYALVGAASADIFGVVSGKAYIFGRNSGTWTQQSGLRFTGMATGDNFGSSVSIFGDHAAVGAPTNDVNGVLNKGSVHFFRTD